MLIDWLREARGKMAGVVINPAGFSFHFIALLDALKMFDGPKVEVHITNIHKREPMYQKSLMSHGVTGVIAGLGGMGYSSRSMPSRPRQKPECFLRAEHQTRPIRQFNDVQIHLGR